MIKKLVLTLNFLLLIGLFYATPSLAVDPQTKQEEIQQRIEQRKLLIEQRKEEIKNRIEIRKATMSARLTERRQGRIRTYFQRLTNRLNSAINRLDILISRIESRVEKIKAEESEIDTDSIEADIQTAKDLLDDAKANLEAASNSFDTVLEGDDPKQAFMIIKDTIKEVKNGLVEVHQLLVHLIGDIKGLRVAVE